MSLFEVISEDEFNKADVPEEVKPDRKYPVPEQVGPLRRYDTAMTCTSRRCGSPTFFKFQGAPLCMIHCLNAMNQMIHDLTTDERG
jgi:hypothetical protein